jgi:hypothetical protein
VIYSRRDGAVLGVTLGFSGVTRNGQSVTDRGSNVTRKASVTSVTSVTYREGCHVTVVTSRLSRHGCHGVSVTPDALTRTGITLTNKFVLLGEA